MALPRRMIDESFRAGCQLSARGLNPLSFKHILR